MNMKLTNGKGDTLMVKYTKTNIHIYNSYAVKKSDIANWIKQIRSFGKLYGCTYMRSDKSWIKEWKAHNVLYKWGIEPDRTKDVDLNEDETLLRRICYSLLSIF